MKNRFDDRDKIKIQFYLCLLQFPYPLVLPNYSDPEIFALGVSQFALVVSHSPTGKQKL